MMAIKERLQQLRGWQKGLVVGVLLVLWSFLPFIVSNPVFLLGFLVASPFYQIIKVILYWRAADESTISYITTLLTRFSVLPFAIYVGILSEKTKKWLGIAFFTLIMLYLLYIIIKAVLIFSTPLISDPTL